MVPVAMLCAPMVALGGVSAAAAGPLALVLPQSTAFSILGHSCGGIQEHAFATGFDPSSGKPTGDVYIRTRCGGSGRGGGYHTTTYSAWVGVTWDFAGAVVSSTRLANSPVVAPTFSATDANGDKVFNTGTAAYFTVRVPGAPKAVVVTQTGDQFQVSWRPAPPNRAVITSSMIRATPVASDAPTVAVTVSGSAAATRVRPLQPQTTYEITVVSTDAGGSSPPSDPVNVTTAPASVAPSAPTGVKARWTSPGSSSDRLLAKWSPATPGDSPVDAYQITIRGSDGAGTLTQTVAGSTLTASFAVSDIPDWSITVRAHNAVGWGPRSALARLGGT